MLHDGRDGIARIADRIWYPVWDSGARLDHAVRTVPQARRVARNDLKVALGLLNARHVAGDPDLTTRLREGALEDWRSNARTRLAELKALHEERTRLHGELAFLLEPDLKEIARRAAGRARHPGDRRGLGRPRPRPQGAGRLRAGPGCAPRAARGHGQTPRPARARRAGRGGPHARPARRRRAAAAARGRGPHRRLRRRSRLPPGGPGRGPPRPRRADATGQAGSPSARGRRGRAGRRGGPGPRRRARQTDPVLVLRAAAAAAQVGLPLAPRALARLAECPPMPIPWPADARNALLALLGAGAERDRGLGGARPGGAAGRADPGLGTGAEPAAAQPAAPFHGRPAPGGVRRERRRADP